MMRAFLFMPLFTFAVVRFGWPMVETRYPDVADYRLVVLMWACMQVCTMFGFIYGFLFLEEKEDNVWSAIQILPISTFKLIWIRLLLGIVISTLVNFAIIHWGQLSSFSVLKELLLAFHFALLAPLTSVAIAGLASNRIEGLAQTKVVNILAMIPALIFFLPYKLLHILALIPTYWSMQAMEAAALDQPQFYLYYLIGLAFYTLCIWWLSKRMERQIT